MKTAEPVTYQITSVAEQDGTVVPNTSQTVVEGGSQTFTFLPSPGFKVSTVTVDSRVVATTTIYTFTDVRAGHVIKVPFTPINYAVRDGLVYYKGYVATGIDSETFFVLGADFGKDRRGVFYAAGERLEEADASTFTALYSPAYPSLTIRSIAWSQ